MTFFVDGVNCHFDHDTFWTMSFFSRITVKLKQFHWFVDYYCGHCICLYGFPAYYFRSFCEQRDWKEWEICSRNERKVLFCWCVWSSICLTKATSLVCDFWWLYSAFKGWVEGRTASITDQFFWRFFCKIVFWMKWMLCFGFGFCVHFVFKSVHNRHRTEYTLT